jgi:acyl carrier protein
MDEAEIYSVLTEIFQDLFADDAIVLSPSLTAGQIEQWDSLNHLNLIVAVESRFGIKMQTQEIETLTNVGDLVHTIAQKRTQLSGAP